jgi:broad specificity phosphatase PhoE
MIELWLVRHAQPEWEPGGIAVDQPGLSDLGRRQAECVASALAKEPFDAIFASPLRRVQETAEPTLGALGRRATVQSWLAEIGLPSFEGRTRDWVQTFFQKARARELGHWWDGYEGGESFRHFYDRVSAGIEGLLAEGCRLGLHEDSAERIWQVPGGSHRWLILAHEGTNAVLLSHLLGVDPVPWAWIRFSSCHAGITRLRTVPIANGAVWTLESFNRVEHLAELGPAGVTR